MAHKPGLRLVAGFIVLSACGTPTLTTSEPLTSSTTTPGGTMQITSPAFVNNSPIPDIYTCRGDEPRASGRRSRRTGSGRSQGRLGPLGDVEHRPRHLHDRTGDRPGRRRPGHEQLGSHRLRRPLSPDRDPPLLLQALRARYDPGPGYHVVQSGCRDGHAGPCSGPSRIDWPLRRVRGRFARRGATVTGLDM